MCICESVCVCVCVLVCVCVQGIPYYDNIIDYSLGFIVYIIVDFVKRGVLTLVGEVRRYRNDRYYYHYYLADWFNKSQI